MDIVPILFQLLLVFFLIAMNGFFVAAEFACVKIRPSRLETLIQEGSRQAKYAKQLTDHLDASLSVTQLGITLASLGNRLIRRAVVGLEGQVTIFDGAAVRIIPEVFAARKFLCPGGHQNQEQGHQQRTPFLHSASPFDSVF